MSNKTNLAEEITINCSPSIKEAEWVRFEGRPNARLVLTTKGLKVLKVLGESELLVRSTDVGKLDDGIVHVVAMTASSSHGDDRANMWKFDGYGHGSKFIGEKGKDILVKMVSPNSTNPHQYQYVAELIIDYSCNSEEERSYVEKRVDSLYNTYVPEIYFQLSEIRKILLGLCKSVFPGNRAYEESMHVFTISQWFYDFGKLVTDVENTVKKAYEAVEKQNDSKALEMLERKLLGCKYFPEKFSREFADTNAELVDVENLIRIKEQDINRDAARLEEGLTKKWNSLQEIAKEHDKLLPVLNFKEYIQKWIHHNTISRTFCNDLCVKLAEDIRVQLKTQGDSFDYEEETIEISEFIHTNRETIDLSTKVLDQHDLAYKKYGCECRLNDLREYREYLVGVPELLKKEIEKLKSHCVS